ncbi:ROM3, partial [Symbiodinium pilosum]
PCVLYQLGASWGPALARGQIWRLVTPVMLHANLTHLLFNVFFQLRMGFGMERQFGREKMMMIYFACGLFGNLMSVAVDPYKLAVGASTAGFGLIGVWLAEILLSWEILGPARERTVIWIVFMMISVTTMSSMTPNMDIFGHLGGALGGFLL